MQIKTLIFIFAIFISFYMANAIMWQDCDASQEACIECGYLGWDVGGNVAQTNCCGDDPDESYNYFRGFDLYCDNEKMCVGLLNNNDDACCQSSSECVANGICYSQQQAADFNNDGRKDGYCMYVDAPNHGWIDCDYGTDSCENKCGYNYVNSGEVLAFGEYFAFGGQECCGDDSNEYYITSTCSGATGKTACCDSASDIVDTSGNCVSTCDSDGDGITDDLDLCPNTPPGETVDANGCSASQLDTDGDGITDDNDACPSEACSVADANCCNGCAKPTCDSCKEVSCPASGAPTCINSASTTTCGTFNRECWLGTNTICVNDIYKADSDSDKSCTKNCDENGNCIDCEPDACDRVSYKSSTNTANEILDIDGDGKSDECVAPCILDKAYWSKSNSLEGEVVNLIVDGNAACIGKIARFTILEEDIIGDDNVNLQPNDADFIAGDTGSITNTEWVAEWQNDGWFGGDPEYKFTAFVNILQIASSEPKLTVSKSMPSCGNGQVDSGENCQNCAEDAGCSSDKLCCVSDSAIECKSSCEIEPPGGCQDQYCRPGYVCSDEDLCNCNAESDDICPSYLSNDCRAVDPDCEIPVECSECIADGACKPDCILNTACPADPDCTCEIYNSYLGDPNIYECPEDQCSEWNARIECCTGACGSSDCFVGWTCPDWSKCVDGYRTRGACTSTSVSAECQDQVGAYFRSEQKKACVESVKFPVYDNLNLLFSILILMGYYLIRIKR